VNPNTSGQTWGAGVVTPPTTAPSTAQCVDKKAAEMYPTVLVDLSVGPQKPNLHFVSLKDIEILAVRLQNAQVQLRTQIERARLLPGVRVGLKYRTVPNQKRDVGVIIDSCSTERLREAYNFPSTDYIWWVSDTGVINANLPGDLSVLS